MRVNNIVEKTHLINPFMNLTDTYFPASDMRKVWCGKWVQAVYVQTPEKANCITCQRSYRLTTNRYRETKKALNL